MYVWKRGSFSQTWVGCGSYRLKRTYYKSFLTFVHSSDKWTESEPDVESFRP